MQSRQSGRLVGRGARPARGAATARDGRALLLTDGAWVAPAAPVTSGAIGLSEMVVATGVQVLAPFAFVALISSVAADPAADPLVYWVSSPVLGGESALLAGAGLSDVSVRLCDTADACLTPAGGEPVEATVWERSVRFEVAGRCAKSPCWARLCRSANASACAAPVLLNAPDVWWHAMPTPKVLRVFGRSLGWSADGACLNATTPLATPSTRLVLSPGGASVGATAATCFEATFPLHTLPPGVYPNAALHTDLGASRAMRVTIARPEPPTFPDLFDVDKSFNSSLPEALAAARASNAAKPQGSAVVVVGSRQLAYPLDRPVEIPDRVTLVGAVRVHSNISVRLPVLHSSDTGNSCVEQSPEVSLIFNLSVPLLNCDLTHTSCQVSLSLCLSLSVSVSLSLSLSLSLSRARARARTLSPPSSPSSLSYV